jgi:hypothetical protein
MKLLIEIKSVRPGARGCGEKCQHLYGWDADWWCELFLTTKQTERRLHCKGGAPQRCPQCLAAEVKEGVPNA